MELSVLSDGGGAQEQENLRIQAKKCFTSFHWIALIFGI